MRRNIYLDYAATTPLDPRVSRAMTHYGRQRFGNPASVHAAGRQALQGIDKARQTVAAFLGSSPHDIIFTSGATESNNLILQGLLKPGDHLITTTIEHPSVLEPARAFAHSGGSATFVPVSPGGVVSADAIIAAIRPETKLISVMYVNNEIGTIQPIAEIGDCLRQINQDRSRHKLRRIFFHTDAAQAIGWCDCAVDALGVDTLTLSGHKICGPKGIGVLYRRSGCPVEPRLLGGHQEYGLRPGTLNSPAIIGVAVAIGLLGRTQHQRERVRVERLRDQLEQRLQRAVPSLHVNGERHNRVGNSLHISFPGLDGESLLIGLDQAGVCVSAGAACSVGSREPSHVLQAIALPRPLAAASLRITLGRFTRQRDIVIAAKKIAAVVAVLQSRSAPDGGRY